MYRTWVIARHTFFEAITQPIYSLLLGVGTAIIMIFALLPFFTLGEDTIMFKQVSLDVVTLFTLLSTLFATSKSIHEEIEDRTMLTLMSKPVARAEVLVGKYLGLIGSAFMAVLVLGGVLVVMTYFRIGPDYYLNAKSIDDREISNLNALRWAHNMGLLPQLLLTWLQVSVLAAVSVAISTRFSLVVNLPAVILVYLAGNLWRFAGVDDHSNIAVSFVGSVVPNLEIFDIGRWAIKGQMGMTGLDVRSKTDAFNLPFIWKSTGLSTLYALCYIVFALSVGMLIFRSRELGGSEG